ncbi:unnamed protein product [Heligmosomoides polygyrus]|uniref:MSP domain-containing protein n=1 Tax=Heligmosomoides polygyrus TaxID=6339 RepID=A0A183FR11_HELPZ|nr:unnamed protein product [Heligmosomoides polygyrus]
MAALFASDTHGTGFPVPNRKIRFLAKQYRDDGFPALCLSSPAANPAVVVFVLSGHNNAIKIPHSDGVVVSTTRRTTTCLSPASARVLRG